MGSELLEIEHREMQRWCEGDYNAWIEISSSDVSYIVPDLAKPARGLNELNTCMQSLNYCKPIAIGEFQDPRIVTIGNASALSYVCQITNHDGSVIPWNITRVYFQLPSGLRLVHSHLSVVQHQAPDLVEVPIPVRNIPCVYQGILGEVMARESIAMERWRKGDPWGFIEISAQDVSYVDTGTITRIDGKHALSSEYTQREGRIFYEVMDFLDPQVHLLGEMAVLYYRFLSTRLNQDGSIASRIPWNCTEVFDHTSGEWLIRHTHWSLINGQRLAAPDKGS